MNPTITTIDSMNNRPHVRHRAVINRIFRPCIDGGRVKLLTSQIATTICGRSLSNYMSAGDSSLTFTNGRVFATECARCFK